jgi:hypothetical protein
MDRETEWRGPYKVKKDDGRRYVEEKKETKKVDHYNQ